VAFQRCDVRDILRSRCRALVANKVVARQDEYLLASVFANNSIPPRLFKCQAINSGNDVYSHRLDADLKRDTRRRKIVFRHSVHRSTEGFQGADDSRRTLTIRPHPHVKVFRRTDMAMRRERMRTHHEKFNAVSVQFDKQISEVLVRRHDSTLSHCE
jgi:hypothetical protein